MQIRGHLVHIVEQKIVPVEIRIEEGRISSVTPVTAIDPRAGSPAPVTTTTGPFILPGFVDAHVHIESSLLPPAEFARLAVVHGTVATVSDPHEIANVLGVRGVDYMISEGRRTPFKFCFGAPACVPATNAETAGAALDARAVARLLARPEIGYLS